MRFTKIIGFTVFSSVFAIMATALSPAATSAKKNIQNKSATSVAPKKTAKRPVRKRYSPWSEPTYADSTIGDSVDGEDLVVRRAAVDALGRYNGSVVVVDPNTGRILTMVNQRLALKSGFQPCSTIKLPVAMAALIEGIINRDTLVRIYGRTRLNLTEAIAHSNNAFFATMGVKLGFERFSYYARLFGLGEKAGLNIDGEQPGVFPAEPKGLDVGIMTSFGEGISLTPLQLAALLSTLANDGTLYYLQYPRSNEEVRDFAPRVKRRLDIEQWLPEVKPGMMAAVDHGTARRANYDPHVPVLGKTGTCTDNRTHLGWFGSFNDVGRHKLVVVVLLTGGSGVSGPAAAQVAGNTYKNLSQENFFAQARAFSPAALVSTQSCCAQ
jgi:cell division protein FtsI/penicillin-binding protein 2